MNYTSVSHPAPKRAFTLIELLIVVAIIAILAAIAVPNFLEAQTRAKVSRARSDMRSIAIAIESYRVDHNSYPEGTDNPTRYPQKIVDFLEPYGLAAGYYTFVTRTADGAIVGRDFANITTPIAYITSIPTDPFAGQASSFLTYCYRDAKVTKNGWVMTSFGPMASPLESVDGRPGVGTLNAANPLSTFNDTGTPKRMGSVNERDVVHYIEDSRPGLRATVDQFGGSLQGALRDLAYDPTNGTISDGDIIYLSGVGFVDN